MAEPKGKPASLQDILNYETDSYFSVEEIGLIQSTFKNPKMIKVLRKAMLPSVGDPELPIEEVGSDMWLSGADYGQMQQDEVKSFVLGRQNAIKFIVGGLIKLKVIANTPEIDPVEAAYRRSKDTNK